MQLTGFHHLTAITADARKNKAFYTQVLGMRLVKRTVNQDDVSAYHLFYADREGSPGTDITFFEWPAPPERRGSRSVSRTWFRVGSEASLQWWESRLRARQLSVGEMHSTLNRPGLAFDDPEGQRLGLVVDSTARDRPWTQSPVPAEHQLRGLGPISLSVASLEPTAAVLQNVMNMTVQSSYSLSDGSGEVTVFSMSTGGADTELHVAVQPALVPSRQGAGGVHHVAFRAPDQQQYNAWFARLNHLRVPNSGPVDRFYFKSLYFREPGGVLFEIATDGPGFASDEPAERLGQTLALPPFLEPRRQAIEAGLHSID